MTVSPTQVRTKSVPLTIAFDSLTTQVRTQSSSLTVAPSLIIPHINSLVYSGQATVCVIDICILMVSTLRSEHSLHRGTCTMRVSPLRSEHSLHHWYLPLERLVYSGQSTVFIVRTGQPCCNLTVSLPQGQNTGFIADTLIEQNTKHLCLVARHLQMRVQARTQHVQFDEPQLPYLDCRSCKSSHTC